MGIEMGTEAPIKNNWLAGATNSANKMAIKFRNWTNEEFRWKWDGVEQVFPANSEIYIEDARAKHFAKHLTDRELNRANLPTNSPRRGEFEVKCYPSDEVITESEALQIKEETKARAKRGRKVKVEEEEFAELKETKETK